MNEMKDDDKIRARPETLRQLTHDILVRYGLSSEHASTVARCLGEADLRGVETHGVALLPLYLKRLRAQLINPAPDIRVTHATPVAASIDGDDGFGFVLATRAMDEAIAMAATYGIGMVTVKRSSHYGMAANYVLQAQRAGYMSLVFTNASRTMPPWGGREGLLGTSPIAAGAPAGDGPPFIFDMSVAVAARGKILLAAGRGEQVPHGVGLDREGRSTTDPKEILEGTVLPVGGPKGSAIAMMMDIFGGVFSGAAFGGDVASPTHDWDRTQNAGHFMVAIKPDLFMPMAEFRERMDTLMRKVKAVPLAPGFDEILIPGERGGRETARRSVEGIRLPRAEIARLRDEAAGVGAPFPPELAQALDTASS